MKKNTKKIIFLEPRSYNLETNSGFSLIESIVYIGLLTIIVSTAIYFLSGVFSTYGRIYAQKEVMTNLQSALDAITQEIKFGKSIYTSTSVFGNDSGQISIETAQNLPSGETTTYVDFYLDNGRIYMKKEGQTELPLTSNQVKINKLRFTNLSPGGNAPNGAQILIEGQFNSSGSLQSQTLMSFTTSAIIRYK